MNDKVFDLGRKQMQTEYSSDKKKETEKEVTSYPSVYIWKAPVELARALAKAGSEGLTITAKIVPVSASETTVLKESSNKVSMPGEKTEEKTPRSESNVEFEIHTIEITGEADEDESESDDDEVGGEELIIKAGKDLGITE